MSTIVDSETAPSTMREADSTLAGRPQPNQSARSGMRVLLALTVLGPHGEHQVADIARVAELRPHYASRILAAAVQEGLAVHGSRHGSYTLASRFLNAQISARSSTPRIQQTAQELHADTGLAVAYHEPGWRPGAGLYLELLEIICPDPALYELAAQQHTSVGQTAAGRAALSFISGHIACDAEGRRLRLEPRLMESITTSKVAACRTMRGQSLAAPVLRGDSAVATLTATGPSAAFEDPLQVQEYAVLLRRAALRVGTAGASPGRARRVA
ncbi:hypothetical protein [Streptomyces niveus]|uniref:hypothetical protein n=1 Tax=Streptomyces niveus TaxID=193462 RepID=UPI003438D4AD